MPISFHVLRKTFLYGLTFSSSSSFPPVVLPSIEWPINVAQGQAFLDGIIHVHETPISLEEFSQYLTQPQNCPPLMLGYIHGFQWLPHLAALQTNESRRLIRHLLTLWMQAHHSIFKKSWLWRSWEPDIMGQRLSIWMFYYDLFGTSADAVFCSQFIVNCHKQFQHLTRRLPTSLDPFERFQVLKGLIVSDCFLHSSKPHIPNFMKLLHDLVRDPAFILDDGGHATRRPHQHFLLLKDLLDIKALLQPFQSHFLEPVIARLADIIEFFRQRDGTIVPFRGEADLHTLSLEPDTIPIEMLDKALSLINSPIRASQQLPVTGYERHHSGDQTLIINLKPSWPSLPLCLDDSGLGILDFAWSFARQRVVDNGDILIALNPHDTLTLTPQEGHNASVQCHGVKSNVFYRKMVLNYSSATDEMYYQHIRELYVGAKSRDLRGEDTFLLPAQSIGGVRFHFPLDVKIEKDPLRASIQIMTPDFTVRLFHEKYVDVIQDTTPYGHTLILACECSPHTPKSIKWAFHVEKLV